MGQKNSEGGDRIKEERKDVNGDAAAVFFFFFLDTKELKIGKGVLSLRFAGFRLHRKTGSGSDKRLGPRHFLSCACKNVQRLGLLYCASPLLSSFAPSVFVAGHVGKHTPWRPDMRQKTLAVG